MTSGWEGRVSISPHATLVLAHGSWRSTHAAQKPRSSSKLPHTAGDQFSTSRCMAERWPFCCHAFAVSCLPSPRRDGRGSRMHITYVLYNMCSLIELVGRFFHRLTATATHQPAPQAAPSTCEGAEPIPNGVIAAASLVARTRNVQAPTSLVH